MKNRKRAGIISASAATLIVGGVAFAAWTSTGTGDGSVTAGTEVDLVVSSAPVSTLYPTVDATFDITVTNPNPYAVKLSTFSKAAGGSNPARCLVTFPDSVPGAAGTVLGADTGAKTFSVTVTMGADSADDCQALEFTQPYEATGASTADPVTP